MISSNLVEQLRRQLIFIRNSVAAYDSGYMEEAVRIAVVIRILCHDTNRSISLFQRMEQKASLKLVSTAIDMPSHLKGSIDFAELMAGMDFGNIIAYSPVPDDSLTIPCSDWWNQPVFLRGDKFFTRKDVVLLAADKDGGAHVDTPNADLQALQESFWLRTETRADGTKIIVPLGDNHFRMLRRFADELLQSQELLKLAE